MRKSFWSPTLLPTAPRFISLFVVLLLVQSFKDLMTSKSSNLPIKTLTFQSNTDVLLNPERGWYYNQDSDEVSQLAQLASVVRTKRQTTLIHTYIDLGTVTGPIAESVLTRGQSIMQGARVGGVKVILRFTYSLDYDTPTRPAGSPTDAPLKIILSHIQQLKPFLAQNSDVIAFVEAGFIGAWGEWHDSTNGG